METLKVLYEDNHVIAVYKPAGILSQGDQTGDENLFDAVKKYLKEKYRKPGNVFLGLVHRLDRPACGVMLFAKTSKGASRLSEQFRNHTIEKTYQVIVCGKPKSAKGILTNFLIKDEKLKKGREHEDGEKAVLEYELVKSYGKYSLLNIKIATGKFHQIRTQLALAGLPILGDVKYKGERWQDESAIALCASEIAFKMATEEKVVRVSAEIPQLWHQFLGA
jgi:23S rRNA pseudouridine1911/1915/1917 synthase